MSKLTFSRIIYQPQKCLTPAHDYMLTVRFLIQLTFCQPHFIHHAWLERTLLNCQLLPDKLITQDAVQISSLDHQPRPRTPLSATGCCRVHIPQSSILEFTTSLFMASLALLHKLILCIIHITSTISSYSSRHTLKDPPRILHTYFIQHNLIHMSI